MYLQKVISRKTCFKIVFSSLLLNSLLLYICLRLKIFCCAGLLQSAPSLANLGDRHWEAALREAGIGGRHRRPTWKAAIGGQPERPPSEAHLRDRHRRPTWEAAIGGPPERPPSDAHLRGRHGRPPLEAALGGRPERPPSEAALRDRHRRPPLEAAIGGPPERPPS
jgi:hypothetical protein